MRKVVLIIIATLAMTLMFSGLVFAGPNLMGEVPASKASLGCQACHNADMSLNADGKAFVSNGKKWPSAAPAASAPAPAAAKPAAPKPPANVEKVINVQNLSHTSKVNGYEVDGKLLAPVRAVVEYFGGEVKGWDDKTSEAILVYMGKEIRVKATVINNSGYAEVSALALDLGSGHAYTADNNNLRRSKRAVITPQWASTRHNYANIDTSAEDHPSKRVNNTSCIFCHNGEGFASGNPAVSLEMTASKMSVSIGCDACHSDVGDEVMEAGVSIIGAQKTQVKNAGYGALCVSCHNGRRLVSDKPAAKENSAPHHSFQADILFGYGGWEFGKALPNSPHGSNPDTCVGCHMPIKDGVMSHDFKVENAQASCSACHPGIKDVNRIAYADYDGDLAVEGIQDEVKGLLELLDQAFAEALPNGEPHSGHGQLYFVDKTDHETVLEIKPELYWAYWNYSVIDYDGSYGVHNPAYAVSLLQESYKQLTGKPVPNAVLR